MGWYNIYTNHKFSIHVLSSIGSPNCCGKLPTYQTIQKGGKFSKTYFIQKINRKSDLGYVITWLWLWRCGGGDLLHFYVLLYIIFIIMPTDKRMSNYTCSFYYSFFVLFSKYTKPSALDSFDHFNIFNFKYLLNY